MQIIEAIILGAVQGITEFLPISSSAHLVILPLLFKWDSPLLNSLTFDVGLHFGTLFAVIFYFLREWWNLLLNFIGKGDENLNGLNKKLFIYIAIATIPGALAGILFEKFAETTFRTPHLIAVTSAIFGIVMGITDRFSKKDIKMKDISFFKSLLIGIAQAFAIIPGISRSGSTITMGLWTGLNRETATRFSFLLSTPVIGGACIYKLKDFLSVNLADSGAAIFAGIISSAIFGFLSIHFLIKFLSKHTLTLFVVYRLIFAAVIVLFL